MNTVWLTARGAGLAAMILLTASTAIGALGSARGRPTTRVILQHVHRMTAVLGLGVMLLHIATIAVDSYAHVGVTGAVIPFTAGFKATWVGIGTIAAYAFLGVAAIGAVRGRLTSSDRAVRAWRGLHGLAYVGWGLAMAHGAFTGTDTGIGWVRSIYLLCAGAVASALLARVVGAVEPDLLRHGTRPGAREARPAPAVRAARPARPAPLVQGVTR